MELPIDTPPTPKRGIMIKEEDLALFGRMYLARRAKCPTILKHLSTLNNAAHTMGYATLSEMFDAIRANSRAVCLAMPECLTNKGQTVQTRALAEKILKNLVTTMALEGQSSPPIQFVERIPPIWVDRDGGLELDAINKLENLITEVKDPLDKATLGGIFAGCYKAGLRVSELLSIRLGGMVRKDGYAVLHVRMKGSSQDYSPMNIHLQVYDSFQVLATLVKERLPETHEDSPLFGTRENLINREMKGYCQLWTSVLNKVWTKYVKPVFGVTVPFHSLRRAAATHAMDAGVSAQAVSLFMRDNISTILALYDTGKGARAVSVAEEILKRRENTDEGVANTEVGRIVYG